MLCLRLYKRVSEETFKLIRNLISESISRFRRCNRAANANFSKPAELFREQLRIIMTTLVKTSAG